MTHNFTIQGRNNLEWCVGHSALRSIDRRHLHTSLHVRTMPATPITTTSISPTSARHIVQTDALLRVACNAWACGTSLSVLSMSQDA